MSAHIFVDTNVLLDVLAAREPFYTDSMRVWNLAERGRLKAFISVISFSNCYYLLRKFAGKPSAEKGVRVLRDVFSPVPFTEQILNQAIDAGFQDFEDAIQFHSALHAHAGCIVTRNVDHFPTTALPALPPAAFLATRSFE